MEPRLLFLILFCLIIGLLHVIAFWRRKPEKQRMQLHGTQDGNMKGSTIAVWQSWPDIRKPAVCTVSCTVTSLKTNIRSSHTNSKE